MTTTTTKLTDRDTWQDALPILREEVAQNPTEWLAYAAGCLCQLIGRFDQDQLANTAALAIERYYSARIASPDIDATILRHRCIAYAAQSTLRGKLAGYDRQGKQTLQWDDITLIGDDSLDTIAA